MKKIWAVLALWFALSASVLAQGESVDEAGVRDAVMAYFLAGNQGDPDLARRAFETGTGVMFIHREDETGSTVEGLNLGDFAARFTRTNPDRTITFHDITVAEGAVASAHITIVWGDREVDDMFLLYKLDGEWKIVAKAFTWH